MRTRQSQGPITSAANGAQIQGLIPAAPRRDQHRVAGCAGCQASLSDPRNRALAEKQLGMGIVPDSGLARLLARLTRPDRRLLLAAIQAAPGKRRAKLQRAVQARLFALGISPA